MAARMRRVVRYSATVVPVSSAKRRVSVRRDTPASFARSSEGYTWVTEAAIRESLAQDATVFQTDETSAMAPVYRHHAKVEAIDADHSQVTDTVEIDAGRLTLFTAAFAHVLYRYRRYRLRGWIAERG